jgi:hypothetical protein
MTDTSDSRGLIPYPYMIKSGTFLDISGSSFSFGANEELIEEAGG